MSHQSETDSKKDITGLSQESGGESRSFRFNHLRQCGRRQKHLIGRLSGIRNDLRGPAGKRLRRTAGKSAPRGARSIMPCSWTGSRRSGSKGSPSRGYLFFSTDRRKFIRCRYPRHEQYTRNMVTCLYGQVAVILVMPARGFLPRPADTAIWSPWSDPPCRPRRQQDGPDQLRSGDVRLHRRDYLRIRRPLGFDSIHGDFRISALNGDNIIEASDNTPGTRVRH